MTSLFLIASLALGIGCKSHCEKTCECYVKKQFDRGIKQVEGEGFPAQVAAVNNATKECMEACEKSPKGCKSLDKACCP